MKRGTIPLLRSFRRDTVARTFVIAEAGVNHNGSLQMAMKMVDAALQTGADAVKFQTFRTEDLTTHLAGRATYQKKNLGENGNQYEMLKRLELTFEDFSRLNSYCAERGIQFLSTPFEEESARFLLQELKMERVKVPSGEITNLPFLKFLARYRRPMILSTGMSDLSEVQEAIAAIRKAWAEASLCLLHCTSNYPCPPAEVNLRAMTTMREKFRLPVGYSDHTDGFEAAVAAVTLGAEVIEKHFTLDRKLPGPDHRCSLEPIELKNYIQSIRSVEQALGAGEKRPAASELEIRRHIRKSLVMKRDRPCGWTLSPDDLVAKRPGTGIAPSHLEQLIGQRLRVEKKRDELIGWEDLAEKTT